MIGYFAPLGGYMDIVLAVGWLMLGLIIFICLVAVVGGLRDH